MRRRIRWGLVAIVFVSSAAHSDSPGQELLSEAKALFLDLKYAEAEKVVNEALMVSGNSPTTLKELYALQGVTLATLKKSQAARHAFQKLLSLHPDYKLTRNYPPRVTTPFFEARGWVLDRGALSFNLEPPGGHEGQTQLAIVKLGVDAMKLAKVVKFFAQDESSGQWVASEKPAVEGSLSFVVTPTQRYGYAELVGERDAVLLTFGTKEAPIRLIPPSTDRVPEHGALDPRIGQAQPATQLPLAVDLSPRPSALRITGYVLIGTGAAAGGLGSYFGVKSRMARDAYNAAPVGSDGITTSITYEEARALDEGTRDNAVIANALFGVAIGLAVTGVILWWLGG